MPRNGGRGRGRVGKGRTGSLLDKARVERDRLSLGHGNIGSAKNLETAEREG
jgi:hypothetical protein